MKANPYFNQPEPPMTAEQLAADIRGTNNGYLFAPTGEQLKAAHANPDKFRTQPNAFQCTSIYLIKP
jgi:hypothetical protein